MRASMRMMMLLTVVCCGAACPSLFSPSSGGGGANGGGGGGASGGPPSGSVGSCVGTAVNPTDYNDPWSCRLQAGIWDGVYHNCESGTSNDCDDVFASSAADEPRARESCLDRIGCSWRHPDGTVESNPEIGGRCEGATPSCAELRDARSCALQTGLCAWADPSPVRAGGCDKANGYIALDNIETCAGISAYAASGSAHWEVARGTCLQRLGCRWVRKDGSVETGPKSGWRP